VDTVYGAGINGFLDDVFGVAILAVNARSAIVWLDVEGVAGYMGTVFATNAGNFVYVNPPLPQLAA
jgi:hypothetical protein